MLTKGFILLRVQVHSADVIPAQRSKKDDITIVCFSNTRNGLERGTGGIHVGPHDIPLGIDLDCGGTAQNFRSNLRK